MLLLSITYILLVPILCCLLIHLTRQVYIVCFLVGINLTFFSVTLC